jgi:hypothetical protein
MLAKNLYILSSGLVSSFRNFADVLQQGALSVTELCLFEITNC